MRHFRVSTLESDSPGPGPGAFGAATFRRADGAVMVGTMKLITYAGGTLLTGDDVAEALLGYVTAHSQGEESIAVEIMVREPDGSTRAHTLVLGPATELNVADVADESLDGESALFPVPVLPPVHTVAAQEPSAETEAEAERHASAFNQAVEEIDQGSDGRYDQ